MLEEKKFFLSSLITILFIGVIISVDVSGWNPASTTAPTSNLNTVINYSAANQAKSGYLAVGTSTAPSYPLDIAGVLRIGRFATAPSGANGALYYNTTSNKFQGYQNGAWGDLAGSALWTASGTDIYYNSGQVGIGLSTTSAYLSVYAASAAGFEIRICYNGVCCPIWKDCDGDGKTYGNSDCDESCSTCYVGSTAYTLAPDGKDQDCDGTVDEADSGYCTSCTVNLGASVTFGYNDSCVFSSSGSYTDSNGSSSFSDTASCSCSGKSCTYSGYANCVKQTLSYVCSPCTFVSCNGNTWSVHSDDKRGTAYYFKCQPVTSCNVTGTETHYQ